MKKRQSLNPSLLDHVQTEASCFPFLLSSIKDLDTYVDSNKNLLSTGSGLTSGCVVKKGHIRCLKSGHTYKTKETVNWLF